MNPYWTSHLLAKAVSSLVKSFISLWERYIYQTTLSDTGSRREFKLDTSGSNSSPHPSKGQIHHPGEGVVKAWTVGERRICFSLNFWDLVLRPNSIYLRACRWRTETVGEQRVFIWFFSLDKIFLVQLKRARVPQKDFCLFKITCVRSVIEYAAPVFHHALPAYLSQELERVQKRAMRIICPGIEYQQALALMSLPTVAEHHHNICTRTFESIMSDPNHKLRKLLPPLYKSNYNLRHARTFTLQRCKTDRFKNSFLWPQAEL